jgi:hypothetical protein
MKPRRVVVEIEMETAARVKEIKWTYQMPLTVDNDYITPIQVQVNVIRQPEPKPKRR